MKKIGFVFLGIAFILIVIELLLVNDNLYHTLQASNLAVKDWYLDKYSLNDWPDTIIMGSSPAVEGINPNVIGKTLRSNNINNSIENFAISADAVIVDYTVLERLLTTCHKCPKNIVYAATDFTFMRGVSSKWQNKTANLVDELYLDTRDQHDILQKASSYSKFYSVLYTSIQIKRKVRSYFVRRQLLGYVVFNLYNFLFPDRKLYMQLLNQSEFGFQPFDGQMSDKSKVASLNNFSETMNNYAISDAEMLYFDKYINLAKQHNINLVIVLPPIHISYLERFKSKHSLFNQFITATAQKHKIPIIDNTNFENHKDILFTDPIHLNTYGAQVYSKNLAAELVEYYKKWNKSEK